MKTASLKIQPDLPRMEVVECGIPSNDHLQNTVYRTLRANKYFVAQDLAINLAHIHRISLLWCH